MHNLALFCKTYIGDLQRVKILKDSVDKYNADKIPFYIVCPQCDVEIMQKTLITGTENYHFEIVTDEAVLDANNIPAQKQNWHRNT